MGFSGQVAHITLVAPLLSPSAGGWTQDRDASEVEMEQRLVQTASTPADHEALAKRFRSDSDTLRMMAVAHRSMGDSYRRSRKAERQKEHCERIAALEEQISVEYEGLSKGHDALSAP